LGSLVCVGWLTVISTLPGQSNKPSALATNSTSSGTNAAVRSGSSQTRDPIARIREEGLDRSQVMQTLSYLTDVIGPRLTGSPNLRRANDWTREKFSTWGLTNANLEPWGPFGRGWSLKRFSAQIIEPQSIPLAAYPKAWSPGLDYPVTGEVIHLDAKADSDLASYKGRLKGAIVLISQERTVKARFEPLASRMSESNLLRLANAPEPRSTGVRDTAGQPANRTNRTSPVTSSSTNGPSLTNGNAARVGANNRPPGVPPGFSGRVLSFLLKEGAAVAVSSSSEGDGGTFFVEAASLPSTNSLRAGDRSGSRVWSTNAPATLPQIIMAAEDYNRLLRMLRFGEKLKMCVELQAEYHEQDLMAYNTVAEIPGTDLKDELVMLGAHMDSWHSGTGATDNGAGVAATMEAVRILQALKLQPRRTIRIALWSGEEQGLLGSKSYVAKHFGYSTNVTNSAALRSPRDEGNSRRVGNGGSQQRLVKAPEYEKLSAYFNLDHGTGKIRGVYMQGNEKVRPIFRKWLAPFADLGAETLTVANTFGTDHTSFADVGLPGFQFIQDPVDYWTRTHHSNADVYDRIQADDLKQCSVILATFVYNAAMADDKAPRKEEPK
jgi:carboxypeptidase Q